MRWLGVWEIVPMFFAKSAKLMGCNHSLTEILMYNSTQILLFK